MKRRVQTARWIGSGQALRLLCFTSLFCCAHRSLTAQSVQEPLSNPQPMRERSILLPEANRPLDPNQQMELREQRITRRNFAAANAERKRQMDEDSARLLKLAVELKLEVEKTNGDMLSVNVIRKADEMERLAHNVKQKMKLTVGGG